MNSGYKKIISAALTVLVSVPGLFAQDAEMTDTRIKAAYYKDQIGQERIVASLLIKTERYTPFANAEVAFFSLHDTTKILIKKMKTDEKGEAVCILKDQDKTFSLTSGQLTFAVEYEGSGKTNSAETELTVKPAQLKVSFFQEDTSKFISVEAFETRADTTILPIAAQEIGLYIKGTFSYFNIAKDVTASDGKLIVPFPEQMPGDTLGKITIAAKIEDSEVYGNVESWGNMNWARPVPLAKEPKRGLGDTDAPLWMVYTLIVLLSAVWLHYAYVLFLVLKIKLARHHV